MKIIRFIWYFSFKIYLSYITNKKDDVLTIKKFELKIIPLKKHFLLELLLTYSNTILTEKISMDIGYVATPLIPASDEMTRIKIRYCLRYNAFPR